MDAKKLNSNNLYQLFSYLKNSESKGGVHINSEGILLYPKVNEKINFEYIIQGHKIKIKTIDLNSEWNVIHKELLKLIELSS